MFVCDVCRGTWQPEMEAEVGMLGKKKKRILSEGMDVTDPKKKKYTS